MFRMIELIDSSEAGFSEAVKKAVQTLLDRGEKVHFFEVVEQREGAFKEFLVKIRAAVEG